MRHRYKHKKIGSFLVPLPQVIESIDQGEDDLGFEDNLTGDPTASGKLPFGCS